jgi:hypothetical protein
MKLATQQRTMRLLDRALIGTLLLVALLALGVELARAAEIVPSVGWSHPAGISDGKAAVFGGLALRNSLLPMVKYEIGAGYRNEKLDDAGTKLRETPITGSLWLSPMPTWYVGGGIGWYNSTLQHPAGSGLSDESSHQVGSHLGGGFLIPIVPAVASLDLNGRYVFLGKTGNDTPPAPTGQADFWSVSAGVAIKLF